MDMVLVFFGVLVGTWALTGLLRYYALKRELIDIPNERSSHSIPTPRGGGGAVVVVFLTVLLFLGLSDASPSHLFWALGGAGAGVAWIGFLDDHGHIPARWRLLVHFLCAGWALAWLGGLPPLLVFDTTLYLGAVGYLLAALYLVWLLNLYNFMDGIDGLAGIEAVTVCLGGAVLCSLVPEKNDELLVLLLLFSAAVVGFLFWNFPKAKIFMGDAGSGFIGMVLGIFSVKAGWVTPELFWGWLILLGVFVVDATTTLVRRIFRGENFYEAHRSHAYQHASRKYNAHVPITLAVGAINLCWLLPLAVLATIGQLAGLLALIIAYFPLVLLSARYNAGKQECA